MAESKALRERNQLMFLLFLAGATYAGLVALMRCHETTVWRGLRDAAAYPELEPYREMLRARLSRRADDPRAPVLPPVPIPTALGPLLERLPLSESYLPN